MPLLAQSIDPDLPVIFMSVVSLIFIAVVLVILAVKFLVPWERRIAMEAEEKAQRKREQKPSEVDEDLWPLATIVGSIALFCLAFVGVLSVVKGLGLGAVGKGVAILGLVGATALTMAIVGLVRSGHGRAVLNTVVALGAIPLAAIAYVLFTTDAADNLIADARSAARDAFVDGEEGVGDAWQDQDFTEVANEPGGEFSELGEEVTEEITELLDDLGLSRPQIPVEEETEATADATDAEDNGGEDRGEDADEDDDTEPTSAPRWEVGDPSSRYAVIESDPYEAAEAAKVDLRVRVERWLMAHASQRLTYGLATDTLRDVPAEEIDERFVESNEIETRESSVGDMVVARVVARIDDDDSEWLVEQANARLREQRQDRGVRLVAAGGAGTVGVLAVLYGVLSIGGGRKAA